MNHDILPEPSSIVVPSFSYKAFYKTNMTATSFLHKRVQERHDLLFTKIESNAHAQSVICSHICSSPMFLSNAHAQTTTCMQLFAGKLTNQNKNAYKRE